MGAMTGATAGTTRVRCSSSTAPSTSLPPPSSSSSARSAGPSSALAQPRGQAFLPFVGVWCALHRAKRAGCGELGDVQGIEREERWVVLLSMVIDVCCPSRFCRGHGSP